METSWLVNINKLRNLLKTGATSAIINARNTISVTKALSDATDALVKLYGAKALVAADAVPTLPTPPKGSFNATFIMHYQVAPVLGTATNCHAAIALTGAAQDITTGITNPDCPRNLSIKGNAASEAGNVVITGKDFLGNTITSTIALNEANEVQGTKCFKTVTNIHVPALTTAGDTVSVGFGELIGMPVLIGTASQLFAKDFNGAADAGTLTLSATAIESCYFSAAGTFDGTKKLDLFILLPKV